jgi:hypothetical protein
MPPLPPRPDKEVQIKKSGEHLLDRTLEEQKAGKETVELSKQRHQQEIDAGKKMVELNQQRAQK